MQAPWLLRSARSNEITYIDAVASASNRLHVFYVYKIAISASVYVARIYSREWYNGRWTSWKKIADGLRKDTNIAAVSRKTHFVDIFAINGSNKVITAAWDNYTDNRNTYRGWWQVANLSVKKDTTVAAAARTGNHLDIFAIGYNSGDVYSAAWSSGNPWKGWWKINNW